MANTPKAEAPCVLIVPPAADNALWLSTRAPAALCPVVVMPTFSSSMAPTKASAPCAEVPEVAMVVPDAFNVASLSMVYTP
ncbi:hypothetical protein D3C85_1624000 [compost metagenome]